METEQSWNNTTINRRAGEKPVQGQVVWVVRVGQGSAMVTVTQERANFYI